MDPNQVPDPVDARVKVPPRGPVEVELPDLDYPDTEETADPSVEPTTDGAILVSFPETLPPERVASISRFLASTTRRPLELMTYTETDPGTYPAPLSKATPVSVEAFRSWR